MEVLTNHGQLFGITTATEGPLPLFSLKALPDFAFNDLLNSCGKCSCLVSHTHRVILMRHFHTYTAVV